MNTTTDTNPTTPTSADAIREWLEGNAQGNDFAASLLRQLNRRGSLSPRQRECVEDNIARDFAREHNERHTVEIDGDLSSLFALFDAAGESGLKRPRLHLFDLVISRAPDSGRNAGCLYVKMHGDYQGKITPDGAFRPGHECRGNIVDIEHALTRLADEPMDTLVQHGRETGNCALCGRTLTDPVSVERGIGPICAGRWLGA